MVSCRRRSYAAVGACAVASLVWNGANQVQALAVGSRHTCVLLDDDSVKVSCNYLCPSLSRLVFKILSPTIPGACVVFRDHSVVSFRLCLLDSPLISLYFAQFPSSTHSSRTSCILSDPISPPPFLSGSCSALDRMNTVN